VLQVYNRFADQPIAEGKRKPALKPGASRAS